MTDDEQPPSDQPEEGMAEGMTEDAPFDEFEGEGGGTKFKDLIDNNPMIKFGLVGAVIITLVGGFMLFGGKKPQQGGSFVARGPEMKGTAPGTAPVSQEYGKAIQDVNKQNVEKALKTGTSALPIPIETPKGAINPGENAQQTEDPLERWRRIQDERTRREQEQRTGLQQKDPNAQAIKDMAQAMSSQMQSILAGIKHHKLEDWSVTTKEKLKNMLKDFKDEQEAALGGGTSSSGTQGPGGQNGGMINQQPVEILLPAGTIGYAQLITGADSDYDQPVLGVIVGGPLAGDRIIGSFEHNKEDDFLVLHFKQVIIDGISHDINALAVDPTTDYSNLATDVDHHYFKRVVIPGAVAFVQALAEGISAPGQSTSQSTTSTVITTPQLKPAQYFWKGLGKSVDKVGDTLDKMNKNVDTTVVVAPGTPIGLIFIDPVTDQAAAGGSPSTVAN